LFFNSLVFSLEVFGLISGMCCGEYEHLDQKKKLHKDREMHMIRGYTIYTLHLTFFRRVSQGRVAATCRRNEFRGKWQTRYEITEIIV
jgi:hypothetical protein